MGKTQLKNETILSLKMQLMECQRCVDMPDCLHAGHACSCSDFLCADFTAPAYGMTLTRKARTVLFALCSFLQFITFPVAAETQADDDYDITSVEIVEEYCCDETEISWPQEEENNVLSLANLGNIFEPGQENQENVCLILPKTCPKYRGGCEEGKYCLPTCYYEHIDAFGCALKTADPAYIAEQTGENGGQWTCHCDPEDEKEWNETARWCCPILGELGMCQTYATDEHGCSMIISCTEGDDCSGCYSDSSSSAVSGYVGSSGPEESGYVETSSASVAGTSASDSEPAYIPPSSDVAGYTLSASGHGSGTYGSSASNDDSDYRPVSDSDVGDSSGSSSSDNVEPERWYYQYDACCAHIKNKSQTKSVGFVENQGECNALYRDYAYALDENGKCTCDPENNWYPNPNGGCLLCEIDAKCMWYDNGVCSPLCDPNSCDGKGHCVSIGVSDVSHVSQPGVSENIYTSDVGMSNMNASDISSSQIGY